MPSKFRLSQQHHRQTLIIVCFLLHVARDLGIKAANVFVFYPPSLILSFPSLRAKCK